MTLTMLGAKATAILAIIGCLSFSANYMSGIMTGYASAEDLRIHIDDYKQSKINDKRQAIESSIRAVEQEIEILEVEVDLTRRERVRFKQLENNKAMLLRKLNNPTH